MMGLRIALQNNGCYLHHGEPIQVQRLHRAAVAAAAVVVAAAAVAAVAAVAAAVHYLQCHANVQVVMCRCKLESGPYVAHHLQQTVRYHHERVHAYQIAKICLR